MHVPDAEGETPQKVQKIINPLISKALQQLVHSNESVRIQNGLNLVQYLLRGSADSQHDREHKYVLKRLIRGAGGSSNASKCGFYTTLVGYLNAFKEKLSLDEIFKVLDNELKVSKKTTTKENADAYIGHILVISALQKCGMLTKKGKVAKALEYVLAASQQKIYHYKLSYNCLINFLINQSEDDFKKTLFPFMRDHLSQRNQYIKNSHLLTYTHNYTTIVRCFFGA
ncbi:hypothetical protein DMENIID0001_131060 [Sergentomyia squamirostris]